MARDKWALVAVLLLVAVVGALVHAATDPPPESGAASPPTVVPASPSTILSFCGMEGLREIRVTVGTLDEEWSRHTGVTKQDLRTQAELHLRGVPGLSITEDAPASLFFVVTGDLDLEELPSGQVPTCLGYVEVHLCQSAQLSRRGPSEKVVEVPCAVTWEAGYLFWGEVAPFGDPRAQVKKLVGDLMDQFVTEYFRGNPELWPSES